jgi:glycerol uptake facilitator-like aquaporin/protein-tyrosine-phosphatase
VGEGARDGFRRRKFLTFPYDSCMQASLGRRAAAEFAGTCLLVAAVIGSGIMGERLAGGNVALALLANTLATGAALAALILTFGSISGAHFNPAVTLCDAIEQGISWRDAATYIVAQIGGGICGAALAHLMFGLSLFSYSQHARHGAAQVFSEFVATFGLMAVIWGVSRSRSSAVPYAVAAYIMAAYWFTASTSFANPAVTIARALSDTFAGIRPADALAFIAAQFVGAMSATVFFRWLVPSLPAVAPKVLVPHASLEVPTSGRYSADQRSARPAKENAPLKTFIFACVHNAGRSQMAAAFFNLYAEPGCRAISAGTQPEESVHPEVAAVMREIGIDLSAAKPQKLTHELAGDADVLVTMGCGESCPYVPGLRVVDWQIPDPKGQRVERVREIRDHIHEQVKALLKEQCAECVSASCC